MGQSSSVVDVVTKRYEFLVELSTPKTKPELVAALDRSRSTVDRAVGALREADLVERTGSEYVVTYAGRQAMVAYEGFRDRLDALHRAHPVLSALPADVDIDPAVLHDADVETASPSAPTAPTEQTVDVLDGTTSFQGTGPAVFPRYVDIIESLWSDTAVDVELVVTDAVVESLDSAHPDRRDTLEALSNVSLYVTGEPMPYAVWTADRADGAVSGIVVYTETGIKGTINNDTEAMNEWAREKYEAYRRNARPLD
ncbi:helix-turn-helix transcriptional regulator [Haloarcula brevis]|uniref:helix-turn-helix transcriptional regulator n=1 Tax=Haloarcula brevis TaxID=3111453 RepID=UPI00300F19C2